MYEIICDSIYDLQYFFFLQYHLKKEMYVAGFSKIIIEGRPEVTSKISEIIQLVVPLVLVVAV